MFNFRAAVLSLGAVLSTAYAGLFSPPILAQTGAVDLQPWEGGGQTDAASDASNPLSGGRSGTGASSLFDLLNRIQLIQSQSGADFTRNQEKNFNKAVEEFQKKQEAAIESEPEE